MHGKNFLLKLRKVGNGGFKSGRSFTFIKRPGRISLSLRPAKPGCQEPPARNPAKHVGSGYARPALFSGNLAKLPGPSAPGVDGPPRAGPRPGPQYRRLFSPA